MENTIRLEQKEKALDLLKKLKVFVDFRKALKDKDYKTMFENGIGYWTWQFDDLENKIKEIENKYGCFVYAVSHEYTDFGELYDLYIVPKYKEDWDKLVDDYDDKHWRVYAYVWNVDDDMCSEFGDVLVRNQFGGIVRTN